MISKGLAYGYLSCRRRIREMVLPIVTTATGAFLVVLVFSISSGISAHSASLGHAEEIDRAVLLIAVTVLLVDERPEEVTAWTRTVPEVEIAAAAADLGAHDQIQLAERTLAKVKRQAEAGEDVVIIVDSLTRLGSAYGDAGAIKPFFGTGREIEEDSAGSVTVIATALWGSPGDQEVMDRVVTIGHATTLLESGLAATGIVPALDVTSCGISGQEAVLDADELSGVRKLRAELKSMEPEAAANRRAELIKGTASNEELLKNL